MKNILTFDIEEWHDANYSGVNPSKTDYSQSNLEKEVLELLDLCDEFSVKATFFILGRVAEKRPDLVRKIKERGHEIASHGYDHKLVYRMSPEEFERDVKKSINVLESITGEKVSGYRAPSFSVKEGMDWFYSSLTKLGLKYSSSVFPIKTFLYGIPKAPRFDHYQGSVLEIPMSTAKVLGKNIPFSGGFYFRSLPGFLIKRAIRTVNKEGKPAIIYLHPREIDSEAPKLSLPFFERFLHYWGVGATKKKLRNILKEFSFSNIRDIFYEQN